MEESKRHSWFSKSQELEIVRVLWSSHHNIHYYTNDLASRKKISLDKIHSRSNAQQYFKEFTPRDFYCWLKTYCCWYKLKLLDNAADSRLRLLKQSVAVDDKMKKKH
nr:hypothetical protein [Tanacetum cinerariifolium]